MNLKTFFKVFCNNTTIHGFNYIGESRRRNFEKIFWAVSLLISMVLTVVLIFKLFINIQRNPIVIYTDDNAIAATDINFPAMTICPSLKLGLRGFSGFNFLQVSKDFESGKLSTSDLSPLHLKYLQIVALITGDDNFFNMSSTSIPTDDIIDRLRDFPFHWRKPHNTIPGFPKIPFSPEQEALWVNQFEVNFTEIIWKTGLCFTFNFPGAEEIFHLDKLSDDFNFTRIVSIAKQTVFQYSKTELKKPLRTFNYNLGLTAEFQQGPMDQTDEWSNLFLDAHPSEIIDGFHLIFHDPFELPSSSSQQFYTLTELKVDYLVSPEMTSIDESLYDYSFEERNCYLPAEKKLTYFKKYLKSNCEHECLANLTLSRCSCAQFFQVRSQSTRVCGLSDASCLEEVEEKFLKEVGFCRCLEPCDRLKYHIELKILHNIKLYFTTGNRLPSTFNVRFGAKYYFELKRKQQFSNVEILSFIGGLLGLFTGFSFISATELIYLLVKSSIKAKSSSKVQPFHEKLTKKLWIIVYFKLFLENSSIHSFSWIAKEKRLAQKIFWALTFVFFMFGFEFVATNMYGKFKSDSIIQTQDGNLRSVSSIPFPAVTLFDDAIEETMLLLELTLAMKLGNAFKTPTKEEFDKIFEDYPFNIMNATVQGNLCHDEGTHFLKTVDYLDFKFEKPTDFVDHIKKWLPQRIWFNASNIVWNKKLRPHFSETLTVQGIGFTFNLAKAEQLINDSIISSDFNYVTPENYSLLRTSTIGGRELEMSFEFRDPRVLYESGKKNIFGIQKFQSCRDGGIFVHSPFALPSNFEYNDYIRFKYGMALEILITPQVIETDDNLKSFSPQVRQCYFEGEKKLDFFRFYSTENCLAECISKIIYEFCGCVQFYYVRNKTMEVCTMTQRDCTISAKKYILNVEYCDCLPSCNSITYETEVRRYPFALNVDGSLINKTTITLRYKDEEFYVIRRYQQFTVQDFLSNIGGLLGVFAGISILSIVEVVFFFTLRLIIDFVKLYKQV